MEALSNRGLLSSLLDRSEHIFGGSSTSDSHLAIIDVAVDVLDACIGK